jgi:hypothetical protein
MEKIFIALGNIPKDKLLHCFYGALIYIVISLYSSDIAFGVVVAIAALKEYLDSKGFGNVELKDFLATIFIPLLLYAKFIFLEREF